MAFYKKDNFEKDFLREDLESLLTKDVVDILEQMESRGAKARLVGGAVRNYLMGIAISDIDIATTASPAEIIDIFSGTNDLNVIPTGIDYGTVTLICNKKAYEITTLRSDIETFGRKARVKFTKSFLLDSRRRDFTINAIYLDKNGRIFDYHNGLNDIAEKNIRFIGEPSARIKEDFLRILRYFRFVALYGEYKINDDYLKIINLLKDNLGILSSERVLAEMLKILTSDDSYRIISPMMPSLNALFQLNCNPLETCRQLGFLRSMNPTERLCMLLKFSSDDPQKLMKKYKFPKEIGRMLRLSEYSGEPITNLNSFLKQKLKNIPRECRNFFVNWVIVLLRQKEAIPAPEAEILWSEMQNFCRSEYVDFNFRANALKDYHLSPHQLKNVMMATKKFWLTTETDVGARECLDFALKQIEDSDLDHTPHEYNTSLPDASRQIVDQLKLSDKISHTQLKFLDIVSFNLHAMILRRKIADKFFLDNNSFPESIAQTEDINVNTEDNHKIRVRIYTPQKLSAHATILLVHGGGWVQGSIETHDNLSRKIANAWSIKVISVDYRLSPEYKFPAPLNDVLNAYKWSSENYNENIILCGDSVGGNLCAALCLKLAEIKYAKRPTAQILFYPVLSSNLESKSFELFEYGYGLTKEWTKNYIYQYTGAEYDDPTFNGNKFIYPLYEENAAIFPPTVLISAGCDVLLDAQLEFAQKLRKANILVHHEILPGIVHGFMTYGKYFEKNITEVLKTIGSLAVIENVT
ncbi:MAG: alpha/beta hydrolase fold domain-containing protein [Holosporaceae bacterium]|jgi:tRNA nucleotidyltransferase/poly(A) polymerase/acetyl esterase/lipase|nr:alpha/beta hydrolase fold domain-containing protein [Holosporaceae bacterium]